MERIDENVQSFEIHECILLGMVADESCRKFKKGTNFSENLYDYMKIGEKI